MIKYEDIPFQYGLCLDANCPKASTCMRQLALSSVPENRASAYILLPDKCTESNGYTHYRSCVKVYYGCGFIKILKDFPVRVLEEFRQKMTAIYTRNRYFNMRKGKEPIKPEDQKRIVKLAGQCGFQGEFTFDKIEEGYLW